MRSAMNNKYKTTMCKHFEQSGQCYLGQKCHFAHGPNELRNVNDPLPNTKTNFGNDSKVGLGNANYPLPASVTNYKTMKCRYFEKGHCKFGQGCSFAHGDQEMRMPNSPIPQNAISNMQSNNSMMSSLYDPGLQNQIANEQIQYLITEVENYHAGDEEIINNLKQAHELTSQGNVQAAASIVYGIINRQYKKKEDGDKYTQIVQNMHNLGSFMYQQIQMQFQQGINSMYGFSPVGIGSPSQIMGMSPQIGAPFGIQGGYVPGFPGGKKGGHSHFEQNGNGKGKHSDGDQEQINGDSAGMSGITNMMGGMYVSNPGQQNSYKNYGGKPKYNNNNQSDQ